MFDAAAITETAESLGQRLREGNAVVVVSAMKGVTGSLRNFISLLQEGNRVAAFGVLDNEVCNRHMDAIVDLGLSEDRTRALREMLTAEVTRLKMFGFSSELAPRDRASILASGEKLSAAMLSEKIGALGVPVQLIDSKDVVVTDEDFEDAAILPEHTRIQAERRVSPVLKNGASVVMTGFYGAGLDGEEHLVGPDGSDYVAWGVGEGLGYTVKLAKQGIDQFAQLHPLYDGNGGTRDVFVDDAKRMVATEKERSGSSMIQSKVLDALEASRVPIGIDLIALPNTEAQMSIGRREMGL